MNSHDGSMACQMYWTPVRVVCWNTLQMSLSQKSGATFYTRHTKRATEAVSQAQEVLGMANLFYEAWGVQATALANKPLPKSKVQGFLNATFGQELKLTPEEIYAPTARSMDEIKRLVEEGRGMDNVAVRGTMYGYYNAVTEFVDHHKDFRDEAGRVIGSGKDMKERAWKHLVKVAKI